MQTAFEALHAWTRQRTDTLAEHVAQGFISPTEFGDQMASLLTIAHTRAVVLGRHHAGDTAPEEADDREFAEQVIDGESEFLHAFVRDIAEGRYQDADGEWRLAGLQRRAGMYSDKIRGTAQEAWGLALPEGTLFFWHLNDAAHCLDCPELEENSPYTIDTIPTWPGKGETECRTSCRCWTRTNDGRDGFRL
jgi:hypothetical protein